jgi:serine/threonine protein kinase
MNQLVGKTLNDRYVLQSLIERGTFQAYDPHTNSSVILKLLLFGTEITWDTVRLFEREANVLKSIDHPAIPKYLDDFEVETELGKGFALVQTQIKARSLKDWVQSGRTFNEDDLKAIAKELLSILKYLHHRQPALIHRDIKPSNVLLGDYPSGELRSNRSGNHLGQIYLVDFGSVQTATRPDGTRTIVGTYGYMPPEQFGGQTIAASDLYALGATLIYLATGQNPVDLPQREMRLLFENQVRLTPNLVRWLRRLSDPDLNRRFQSADIALAALENPEPEKTSTIGLVTQPIGSKVAVTKTDNTLEVFIAPYGLNSTVCFLIFFTVVWDTFLVFWYRTAILTWSIGGWIAALFGSLHLLFGIGITYGTLFTLFGTTEVEITRSQIRYISRLFGIALFYRTFLREEISAIKVSPRSHKDTGEGKIEVPPKLILWFGGQKIELGSGILNESDLAWLAQELSNWLNLPVTK